MRWTKQKTIWFLLLALLLATEWIKTFPAFIEKYYTSGLYPYIGNTLRKISGSVPFSIGDISVGLLVGWLLFSCIVSIKRAIRPTYNPRNLIKPALNLFKLCLCLYLGFNWIWGFNYYRLGSAHLFELEPEPYKTEDLSKLVAELHNKIVLFTNDSLLIEQSKTNDREKLSVIAYEAYRSSAARFSFLSFNHPSLKPNLIGKWQGYTGYAGYLFPFTGEAHVNFFAPSYSLPFSVCHEMAHQAGFGSESEANLIGFLTARASINPAFRYSAYSGVYSYALSELFNRDSLLALSYYHKMPAILKKDRKAMQTYLKEHESFLQPGLDLAYEWYLKSQNQEKGLASYNDVVAWLIAYGKKFGWKEV